MAGVAVTDRRQPAAPDDLSACYVEVVTAFKPPSRTLHHIDLLFGDSTGPHDPVLVVRDGPELSRGEAQAMCAELLAFLIAPPGAVPNQYQVARMHVMLIAVDPTFHV